MQRSGEGGWCNGAQPLLALVCLGLYYHAYGFVLGGERYIDSLGSIEVCAYQLQLLGCPGKGFLLFPNASALPAAETRGHDEETLVCGGASGKAVTERRYGPFLSPCGNCILHLGAAQQ